MDLSPILIAALVPYLALVLGVRRHRIMWIAITVTFPLSGLCVVAATNGQAGGPTLFVGLCAVVVVVSTFGWIRWSEPLGPVSRDRRAAVLALALWFGVGFAASIVAIRADAPVVRTTLGYAAVGLLVAALVLLAGRDDRGWATALVSFGLTCAIVVPESAATFGAGRWGLLVVDLGLVAIGAVVLLIGRRTWRHASATEADGGQVGAERRPMGAA
jgi:hypothetical protein